MYDLLIIGAGPAGLAAGIEAKARGLSFLILEKESAVNSIRRFPANMTFFSTPELIEIGGLPFVSSGMRPTRIEAVKYYQRVIEYFNLPIRCGERVDKIGRSGGLFDVRSEKSGYQTKMIVIATGYFDNPRPYNVTGADSPFVSRYYDEPYRHFKRNVAVVGGSNSAAIAALELYRGRAAVTLIHRGPTLSPGVKYWIEPDIENRIKNGEIKAYFNTEVTEIGRGKIKLSGESGSIEIENDFVYVLTGFAPDTRLLESAGVTVSPDRKEPVFDQQTMETDVKGVFIAGSVAGGVDNNKIFIENGRKHGKIIVDSIMERLNEEK